MKPQSIEIRYFSGTGNTKRMCHSLAASFNKAGLKTSLNDLALPHKPDQEADLLMLAWPTLGFNAPWLVLKYLWGLQASRGQKVFLASSRTGMPAGSKIIWGVSGLALWLPWLMLALKGYRVRGLMAAELPSNWVTVHPGPKTETAQKIFKAAQPLLDTAASKIINGQTFFQPRLWAGIPFDVLVLPLSMIFPLVGRIFLAKMFFAAPSKCVNCGLCAIQCPAKAITLGPGRPFWTHRCESCMRCLNLCPHRAVFVMRPFLIVFGLAPLYLGGFLPMLAAQLAGIFAAYYALFKMLKNPKVEAYCQKISLARWPLYQAPPEEKE